MPARGTGPALQFWGTILPWGARFSLGGISNDLGDTIPKCPSWLQACLVGLVTIVDIVSIVGLVGMVDVVGLVDIVSKYSRHSRQNRHSLTWDNKTLTLLCLSEQPVFHFVYTAFTKK